jgi:ATP-binding cassette subfamily B protein
MTNLGEFLQGRTAIIIAHRLSTVKQADQIVVIENGTISEVGDHYSLLEKRGSYYRLVKNQLELDRLQTPA